jgi:hypothetical protein
MKAECPVCTVALDAAVMPVCRGCGLTWRVPSPRAVPVPAAAAGQRARSLAFRPRVGDVLSWTAGFALISLLAAAIGDSAVEGSLLGGTFLNVVVVLACAALWLFAATGWARVVVAVVAPLRVGDEGEVISLRAGGLDPRGWTERRIAKIDLREVVLEPVRGVVFQLWVVHRAGPAFRLDAEILGERGERLGGLVGAWIGDRAAGPAGYRSAGTPRG